MSGRLIVVAAGVDDGLDDPAEEVHVAARGVFRRKLHVVGVVARLLHGRDRVLAGTARARCSASSPDADPTWR